ncbi:MAG TPA: hypothetical protein V6D22_18125 [Candidatus Obscuribacterales bacterium]
MTNFEWPVNIKFDDSEDDIKEARLAWQIAHSLTPDAGFLHFMQTYAAEVKARRNRDKPSSTKLGAQ